MTTRDLIEQVVALERLMAEEISKGLPNDYLRGRVEGKRDAYRRVLEMLTGGESPTPVEAQELSPEITQEKTQEEHENLLQYFMELFEENIRKANNAKLRGRYQLARDLGFPAEEARILSFKNEAIIIKLSGERGKNHGQTPQANS